jgi:hypothetical protein
LVHAGIETEVAHQPARVGKATYVSDVGQEGGSHYDVDPGDAQQAAGLGRADQVPSQQMIQLRDLEAQRIDLAQAADERDCLLRGKLERCQPASPGHPKGIGDRRARAQVACQHRVNLVLGPPAGPHHRRPPGDQAPKGAGRLIWRPHAGEHAGTQQTSQGAGIHPVRLGPRRDLAEPAWVDHDHMPGAPLHDAGDRRRGPGGLDGHDVLGPQARGKPAQVVDAAGDPLLALTPPGSRMQTWQASRWTSMPMNVIAPPLLATKGGGGAPMLPGQVSCPDNASEFTSAELVAALVARGARNRRIHAGRPQSNGAVERVQLSVLDECWRPAFARSPSSPAFGASWSATSATTTPTGPAPGGSPRAERRSRSSEKARMWLPRASEVSPHLGVRTP